MDARQAKYRSLDAKAAASAAPPKTRERHNSAPMGDRPKAHHSKRQSATSKSGESNGKSSRVTVLEDIPASEDSSTPGAYKSDRRHTASRSVGDNLTSKVRCWQDT